MKPLARALFAFTAVALGGLAPSTALSAAPPPTYPLVCKGGPGMMVEIWPYSDHAATVLWVDYRWARQGAGQAPPAAGECTWLDRAGRTSEPTRFKMKFTTGVQVKLNGRGQITRVSGGGHIRPLEGIADGAAGARILQDIIAGRVFYFHGYSQGSTLMVTRLGP